MKEDQKTTPTSEEQEVVAEQVLGEKVQNSGISGVHVPADIPLIERETGVPVSEFSFQDVPQNGEVSTEFKDHPLCLSITRLFRSLHHPEPESWLEGVTEKFVSDPRDMRILVNDILMKHLRRLDLYTEKSSFHIREDLGQDSSMTDYLIMLEEIVIPFMVQNELPMKVTEKELADLFRSTNAVPTESGSEQAPVSNEESSATETDL